MLLSTRLRRLACVALTVVASTATQTGPHVARAESDHVVLAYYYGMGSGDVRRQVQQAQAAGIDGFTVWWDGIGGGRDQQRSRPRSSPAISTGTCTRR
jgi:hypothetical protein